MKLLLDCISKTARLSDSKFKGFDRAHVKTLNEQFFITKTTIYAMYIHLMIVHSMHLGSHIKTSPIFFVSDKTINQNHVESENPFFRGGVVQNPVTHVLHHILNSKFILILLITVFKR